MILENLLTLFALSPEAAEEQIKETIEQFKPVAYSAMREGFEVFKDLVANEEYFTQRAKFKRNMYDAYVSCGFSSEQAMVFLVDNDMQKSKMLQQLISSANVKSISR